MNLGKTWYIPSMWNQQVESINRDFKIQWRLNQIIFFLGISILYRKPTSASPNLLSFLGPFSKDVWVYLIVAYIVVSMLLFVIGKLCPIEWTNPYFCIKEPEVLETPFTFMDTPFFIIGALLKSPTGFAPAWVDLRFVKFINVCRAWFRDISLIWNQILIEHIIKFYVVADFCMRRKELVAFYMQLIIIIEFS